MEYQQKQDEYECGCVKHVSLGYNGDTLRTWHEYCLLHGGVIPDKIAMMKVNSTTEIKGQLNEIKELLVDIKKLLANKSFS